jgi:predicted dehydrogenase
MKILLIGSCGSIGRVHQRNLKMLGENNITCIDKILGTDLSNIESVKEFELIIIASPTDTHYELLHACIQREATYVMVEKPLFSLPTPNQIAESFGLKPSIRDSSNTQIFVNNAYRFAPGMIELKEKLSLVGKIRHVSIENSYAYEKLHNYPYEKYEGIIYDDCHIINSSRFIFGEPKKILYKYVSKNIAQFAWELEDGTVVSHSTDCVGQRYKKRIEVKGDEGTLIYNFKSHEIWFEPKDESERVGLYYKFKDHLFESMKYVLKTVEEKGIFETNDPFDAVKDLEIIRELTNE